MTAPALLIIAPNATAVRPLRTLLQDDDYALTEAASAAEAFDHLHEGAFEAAIAFHQPPEMNGLALLGEISNRAPRITRLLWTTARIDDAIQAALDGDTAHFLLRPDTHASALRATIRHAVAHTRLNRESATEADESDADSSLAEVLSDRDAKLPGTFAVLMRLMHLHSASLHRHAHRVADVARRMAQRLKLPPETVNQIEVAALLHDVGKVLIDPSTIRKPASLLTPEERSPMRNHPEWGEDILSVLPSLDEAAEYVRHHHENFDGSGYPDQLPTCQIPLGSRIISVANAFDNIHNGRSVFRTHTPETALNRIREDAPTKHDPALVDVLAHEMLEDEDASVPRAVGIRVEHLEPGMRLGQDFAPNPDLLLLARGARLRTGHIIRIQQISQATPSFNYVLVYAEDAPELVPASENVA